MAKDILGVSLSNTGKTKKLEDGYLMTYKVQKTKLCLSFSMLGRWLAPFIAKIMDLLLLHTIK